MSTPNKRIKFDVDDVDGDGGLPSPSDDFNLMDDIAIFMAPSTRPNIKTQAFDTSFHTRGGGGDDDLGSETHARAELHLTQKHTSAAAATSDNDDNDQHITQQQPTKKRKRDNVKKEPTGFDLTDVTKQKERDNKRRKRKQIATTDRLGYMSRHGFIHSTLPLLTALTRERLLEYSFKSASSSLSKLFPAYRLDMDTIFQCSIEILEKVQQLHEEEEEEERKQKEKRQQQQYQQTYDESDHHSRDSHHVGDMNTNQLTRFYRKILNLQPKNLLQVVFELGYLFLSQGSLDSAYDHWISWSQNQLFIQASSLMILEGRSSTSKPVVATMMDIDPIKYLNGCIGRLEWECAKQAHQACIMWEKRLKRRQAGEAGGESDADDSNSEVSSTIRRDHKKHSHTLERHQQQTTSDLMFELRTARAKRFTFEKSSRSRLKSCIQEQPESTIWLETYLECMDTFYRNALPIDEEVMTTLSSAAAAASSSAPKGARSNLQSFTNLTKRRTLYHRLMRQIDIHLATSGTNRLYGFEMKLKYLQHFSHVTRLPRDRRLEWITVKNLVQIDPSNNNALRSAWRLWREQGEMPRRVKGADGDANAEHGGGSVVGDGAAGGGGGGWFLRHIDLIDLIGDRLDIYSNESWSWLLFARVLSSMLRLDSNIEVWPIPGPSGVEDGENDLDEVASLPDQHQQDEQQVKRSNQTMPSSHATPPPTPILKSMKNELQQQQQPQQPQPDPPSDSESSAGVTTPMSTPRRDKKKPMMTKKEVISTPHPSQQQHAPERSVSIASSSNMSDSQAASSQQQYRTSGSVRDELDATRPLPSIDFQHLHLSNLNEMNEIDRRNRWLGRIEWWIQAEGWWRGMKPLTITKAPERLPQDDQERIQLLKGLAYSMVLTWMGL